MPSKRVLFLGAFVALAASGADARALLQEPGAVAADPADLACGACKKFVAQGEDYINCLLYTSPSPRDLSTSRMPSSA